jgi:hypothetical protein
VPRFPVPVEPNDDDPIQMLSWYCQYVRWAWREITFPPTTESDTKRMRRRPLERSSIEASISIAIAIGAVVFPITWYLKIVLLFVLWALIVDLVRRSPLTINYKPIWKLGLIAVALAVLVKVAWKPILGQYHDEMSSDALVMKVQDNVGYKSGTNIAGIKWDGHFRDLRMTLDNTSEYPIQNLQLTVRVVQNGDVLYGIGQLSDIPGVEFHPADVPDATATFKGVDGQKLRVSLRDMMAMVGGTSFAPYYKLFCPTLPSGIQMRLTVAGSDHTGEAAPKKLQVFGTYEIKSAASDNIVKVNTILDVTR